jgi:2-methylfumaryl-CoA hydratase
MTDVSTIAGPYFEDFRVGEAFDAPSVTLHSGHAALYQAITGDRMRLPLDHALASRVCGAPLIHPMLAINAAIGQTTWASQRVKANLFYRGLVLKRPVFVGDTLTTTSKVVALKQNRVQPGRDATGVVALEMRTRNQDGADVLHFWRCPMIPCRTSDANTGESGDMQSIGETPTRDTLQAAIPSNWQLDSTAAWVGASARDLHAGQRFRVEARDTVTSAPELVRLTLNMAMAHTDAALSYLGERLVYGGHTISIAFAQLTRALPNLLTLVAWESCDHTGPVLENDRLRTEFAVEGIEPARDGALVRLRVETYAARGTPETETRVLDWRLVVWSR